MLRWWTVESADSNPLLRPFLALDGSQGYQMTFFNLRWRKNRRFPVPPSQNPRDHGESQGFHNMMDVIQRLVDKGNSVLVIEHNLDVIRCSDWIIDLGPEGGDKGGQIVVTGTPEDVAAHPTSHTGKYLKQVLAQHPPEVVAA